MGTDQRGEPLAIRAEGLTKRYGDRLAVDAFCLAIPFGEFYGLLGPNGAGKTTAVHMLSTLIKPTSGEAWVAARSVRSAAVGVRAAIGVVFQDLALDRNLSVAQNLRFAGMLNHMSGSSIRVRSAELLELFGLATERDEPVASLSGGMRRAVDIARALIHDPQVLFLDEPTIGLDLPNRRAIWRHIATLRRERRTTVVLTTHYLEEATECDRVGFIDAGRLVQEGPPQQLIAELGEYIIEIEAAQPQLLAQALNTRLGGSTIEGNVVSFRFDGDVKCLTELYTDLIPQVRSMRWRKPNLNDVFLWIMRGEYARPHASTTMRADNPR